MSMDKKKQLIELFLYIGLVIIGIILLFMKEG
jgi:hypothetical protein